MAGRSVQARTMEPGASYATGKKIRGNNGVGRKLSSKGSPAREQGKGRRVLRSASEMVSTKGRVATCGGEGPQPDLRPQTTLNGLRALTDDLTELLAKLDERAKLYCEETMPESSDEEEVSGEVADMDEPSPLHEYDAADEQTRDSFPRGADAGRRCDMGGPTVVTPSNGGIATVHVSGPQTGPSLAAMSAFKRPRTK